MEIRLLFRPERPAAIQLIWAAFLRYEAPDYSPEGIEAFRRFIEKQQKSIGNIRYRTFPQLKMSIGKVLKIFTAQ